MAAIKDENQSKSKDNQSPAHAENARQSPRFLGSLRDALRAAGISDDASKAIEAKGAAVAEVVEPPIPHPANIAVAVKPPIEEARIIEVPPAQIMPEPSAHGAPPEANLRRPQPPEVTLAVGRATSEARAKSAEARTQLVRGRLAVPKTDFHQDPVVGWLVVVGGQGLGAFRPIFEGNNTIGRARTQRIAVDFGDEAISNEEQAYIRYDSADRSFLFVPNLSKTNVVSVNNKKPTAAVPLEPMDVITMGRTQLAFVPFCGNDFDWSELADRKK